ncbi:helix-turn-helix domain-containing protein [Streptomyces sp. NBC_00053]|uniref:PucR family transcriptional regulator n=1 Tax=unclassified Streptomyces TaxID=2593676 RepID=UPI00224E41E8|nr:MULTISPECIES: PucR family transcriptional regulator [unclassified Streptomyces]MCX5499435.1 helix-turn-helix domain-containing protein [Streptomyces sp. NBC_00052]MCX5552030.1 helix-turn-helix domain-containing protein [Streptomyces sp. NBC_00051]
MANILELLSSPGLEAVRPLVGPLDAVEVTGVRLEPRPDRLAAIPAGTVAVLLAPVPGHLLDVAVRDAAAAGAAALVLTGVAEAPHGLPAEVTATARALAERGRVAVLYAEGDLAALVVAVERTVAGSAADALARVAAAAGEVTAVAGDPDRVAAAAGRALGVPVELRAAGPGEEGAVAAGPDGEIRLAAPARPGHAGTAVRSVLALAALAAAGGGHGDVPVRSRGRLLAELLVAPEDQAARLAARGRALALPVDGWHIALRLEAGGLDASNRPKALDAVMSQALTLLRTWDGATAALSTVSAPQSADSVQWNAALVDDALVLLSTWPAAPGADGRRATLARARRVVDRLAGLRPEAGLRCGVGSPHRGPLGIRTSAREARAAVPRGAGPTVAAHDAVGLDRMLLEWYASDTAREAVSELLAPVLALGPKRAEPLLRTLQGYLDHNNSPARAADALHLHRNAVGARIRKIVQLTGADLNEPDVRLALQLACRAGLSAAGSEPATAISGTTTGGTATGGTATDTAADRPSPGRGSAR